MTEHHGLIGQAKRFVGAASCLAVATLISFPAAAQSVPFESNDERSDESNDDWEVDNRLEVINSGNDLLKASNTGNVGIDKVGQRRAKKDIVPSIRPLDRINNRIQNRIENRLSNRVDRDYNANMSATLSIEAANKRQRSRRGPRD